MNAPPAFPSIPGYRIERLLGEGGMACVYLARQLALDRDVAIKVMAPERTATAEAAQRFEQETRVVARLDHPRIVSIHEVGRTPAGLSYFTMPHLANGDLSRRDLRGQPRAVIAVVRALAEALGYAHAQGIVHRDVKPENVLFDKLDRPLLADFGIALAGDAGVRVTREGATLGSTGYMSPEQARGLALDGRSDLYSLGVMVFELVTGHLPYDKPDALAVALAHVEEPVPRLPPTLRVWQPLIDRAMAKQPAQRFQDAAEFLAALDKVEAHVEGRDGFAALAPEPLRRGFGPPIALVAGIVACVALGAWYTRRELALPPDPTAAEANAVAATSLPAAAAPPTTTLEATHIALDPPAADAAATAPTETAAATPTDAAADAADPGAGPGEPVAPQDPNGPRLALVPAPRGGGAAFALAVTEVTRAQYAVFARAERSAPARCRSPHQPFSRLRGLDWRHPGFDQTEQDPVVCVSWLDAQAYTRWLSRSTGAHYRLPTGAEWQRAAAGLGAADACRAGDVADLSKNAFTSLGDRYRCNDGYAFTAPVGRFRANAYGIYDLLGNASEWTLDCSRGAPFETLLKDDACPERRFRGTSWRDGPGEAPLAHTGASDPDVGYTTVGFRVLREADAR